MSNYKKQTSSSKNQKSSKSQKSSGKPQDSSGKKSNNHYSKKPNNIGYYQKQKTQVKAVCQYLNNEGKGIIKDDKKSIPIDYLLPGEEALVEYQQKGHYFDTKILSLIQKSKKRISPPCPYYYSCGGCQLQHLNYEAQLEYKLNTVKALLKPYYPVDSIISMDDPSHYRNKSITTFGRKNKQAVAGFYKPYSHDLVSIDNCLIQDKVVSPIIATIKDLIKQYKIQIFDEDTEKGFLRHVLIRTGYYSNDVMVVFVVTDKIFPSKNNFVKIITEKHPEISTIVMNLNSRQTSAVLSTKEFVLYGDGYIHDNLCGLTFRMASQSFYQINPIQTEKMYNLAIEYADIKSTDVVLDTYSGIGTISLIAAKKAQNVYGVEVNKAAVQNAIENAKLNHINNVRFVEADATHAMIEMAKEEFKVDVLFMDPPREGSTPEFIKAALELKPRTIVYISCNPETQARDLKLLTKKYKVEKAKAVDMFPHTNHVETVVKLQHQNP
ncbi:MAG: 23S rRNA (uracil(1939)-C(5))-methyltransferase RlmD [Clostridia bacterium]|nr:23S rRNA (uracil(1939)-C(5))-methyltransferase RlmD [Clostridia bacterium]